MRAVDRISEGRALGIPEAVRNLGRHLHPIGVQNRITPMAMEEVPTLSGGDYVDVPGDFKLWTYPTFKDDLERAKSDPPDMPRERLIAYVTSSLPGMGVSEDLVLPEISELFDDPAYVELDRSIDTYWQGIQATVDSLAEQGIHPKLNTSEGETLSRQRAGYAKNVIVRILGRWETKVLASERLTVPVRVFTLHCPKVTGASCVYTENQSTMYGGSFDVRVFGVGGGGGANATLETGARHMAANGNCYQIVKAWTVLAERCVELHHGVPSGDEYIRVSPIGLQKGYQKLDLPADDDACLVATLHDTDGEPADLSTAADGDGRTKKITGGLTASFGVDLDLPTLQTKVKIGVETSSTTEKSLDYTLPGLHRYLCFHLTNDFGYAWESY